MPIKKKNSVKKRVSGSRSVEPRVAEAVLYCPPGYEYEEEVNLCVSESMDTSDLDSYIDILNGLFVAVISYFVGVLVIFAGVKGTSFPFVGLSMFVVVSVFSYLVRVATISPNDSEKDISKMLPKNILYSAVSLFLDAGLVLVLLTITASRWRYGVLFAEPYYFFTGVVLNVQWFTYVLPSIFLLVVVGVVYYDRNVERLEQDAVKLLVTFMLFVSLTVFVLLSFSDPEGNYVFNLSVSKEFFTTDVIVAYFVSMLAMAYLDGKYSLLRFRKKRHLVELVKK